MSLDKKKQDITKRVSFVGTPEDMESLADAVSQIKRMFNLNIDVKSKDMPIRISLRPEIEPEAITYPRVARALTQLDVALKKQIPLGEDSQTIPLDIGSMEWIYDDPRTHGLAPVSVRVLQSITEGVAMPGLRAITPAKHYAGRDIKQEFNSMFDGELPDNMRDRGGLFPTLDPEWVYVQTAEVWPNTDKVVKNKKELEDIKKIRELEEKRLRDVAAYPPNLGVIESSKGKKVEPTQAIVAVFRGEIEFDMHQEVNINTVGWSGFVKQLPEGMLSKELTRNKPKTVGDLLNVFFAYNVASFMRMQDATVRPISKSRTSVATEHMYGDVRVPKPGQPQPLRKLEDKILYSALVVGTGKFRPGFHDVAHLSESEIPGWS
jgi:hypothetical protein